jgi:hypothetical protein
MAALVAAIDLLEALLDDPVSAFGGTVHDGQIGWLDTRLHCAQPVRAKRCA